MKITSSYAVKLMVSRSLLDPTIQIYREDVVLEQILQAEKYPGDVIENDDEDFSFYGREAFGERHGQNFDWAIHEIG